MSILGVLVNVFAGILLADHYKVDRLKGVLGSAILGWFNAWVFLHLTVRKGWGTGKAVGVIVIGWTVMFWIIFAVFFTATIVGETLVRL